MASSLKHELRTPLNHILGYCEMLMEEAEDKRLSRFLPDLQRIHAAGRRLLTVINDLFDPTKETEQPIEESVLHHEVRTPLNQIIGYTEMLEEDAIESDQTGLVPDIRKIHAAAHQLLQLVLERLVPSRYGVDPQLAEIESAPTTFTRKSEVLDVSAAPNERPWGGEAGQGRLLVVDDNALNRDMLSRRLARLGYQVSQAENGEAALRLLREGSFDLLLLDIMMPIMNGYEVLERMGREPAWRHLPVIVLSASDETQKIARCIEMGAEDYLPKPFDPVLLQTRISTCLEKKRLRDQEALYLRQIEEEKKRSDDLLHVILPADIASELKATQRVKPRRFDSVAVLFCDIAGFTSYCERHEPETVHQYLQTLVETFERLAVEHGLEKIKTIGDSFMATAGLLTPLADPSLSAVRCGLAMIQASSQLPPHWNVRVGLHVGPVIAGVVGHRKYQYDVWGDTVNMAARMESAAAPGTICVSADTWELLRGHCRGHSLGLRPIKGKAEQELFVIEGLVD